jgi:mRNA interferase MazF
MTGSDSRPAVWDIVKVPFPYMAGQMQQRRPALVISLGQPTDSPFVVWVLMITSAENRPWPGDVPISDLATAGLPVASVVRPAKVATVEIARLERIGTLPARDEAGVRRHLRRLLSETI